MSRKRRQRKSSAPAQLRQDLISQKDHVRARDTVERNARAIDRAARRRPGRGTGTSADDLWQPTAQADAYSPEDERVGKVFCKDCGSEVRHVEVDGTWHVRNADDDLPHALSCSGSES